MLNHPCHWNYQIVRKEVLENNRAHHKSNYLTLIYNTKYSEGSSIRVKLKHLTLIGSLVFYNNTWRLRIRKWC